MVSRERRSAIGVPAAAKPLARGATSARSAGDAAPRRPRRPGASAPSRGRRRADLAGDRRGVARLGIGRWPAGRGSAADAPIPFWAFAWAGGLALARHVLDHPDEVRGRRVLDFATGSGLVGIAAAIAGAGSVEAADIDPFAEVAVALNARANGVSIDFVARDLLDDEPPDVDVLLAADTWYESRLGERVAPWLRVAADRGIRVLVGDPVRRYLPTEAFVELAAYDVETTTELEDRPIVRGRVFTLAPHD